MSRRSSVILTASHAGPRTRGWSGDGTVTVCATQDTPVHSFGKANPVHFGYVGPASRAGREPSTRLAARCRARPPLPAARRIRRISRIAATAHSAGDQPDAHADQHRAGRSTDPGADQDVDADNDQRALARRRARAGSRSRSARARSVTAAATDGVCARRGSARKRLRAAGMAIVEAGSGAGDELARRSTEPPTRL